MPKMLSLPGLYIINQINAEISAATGRQVIIFSVTDSFNRRKREYRFDAVSIIDADDAAKKAVENFIASGKIMGGSKMSPYPTPSGYSQSLKIASLDRIRNQPCLVRYTYTGRNIGMLFYPHEISF